jgi:hypothetical protein
MDMTSNISAKDVERLHARTQEFGTLTPRELTLYLAGQADGKSLKADEIAPRLASMELTLVNAGVLFPNYFPAT